MFENIRNVITSLLMDRLRPILGGHIPSCPRHVPHDSVAITRLLMDRLERNLVGHIPSCARHVRYDSVAMATAVTLQRRIEHYAVMGVWRPNA